jgi:hypothetical protein
MVKGVKETFVVPWVRRRVKTNLSWRAGFDFTKEWNFAIKVCVPSDRANRSGSRSGKGSILAQGLSVSKNHRKKR